MSKRCAALMALLVCGTVAAADPPVPERSDPWLGVFLGDAVDGGVELVALVSGGPAALAGLEKGDIVIRAGDLYLAGVQDLEGALEGLEPGDSLALQLLRRGEPFDRVVELASRPEIAWPSANAPAAPVLRDLPPPALPPPPLQPVRLGLKLTDVTPDLRRHYGAPEDAGVLVTGVIDGLPAERAGVRVGDVIVKVGEIEVRDVVNLERLLRVRTETDGEVSVSLVRAAEPVVVELARSAEPVPAVPEPTPRAREALVQSLELEIRRLEERIEQLRREVAALKEQR